MVPVVNLKACEVEEADDEGVVDDEFNEGT